MHINKRLGIGALGSLIAFAAPTLLPVAARAQDPGSADTTPVLEEVLVTARKRTENIQEVPIAITALSAEDLRINGITTPDALQFHTPGLQIRNQSIQRASISYFIRGQGQTFGSSPSVVTYFADAPLGNGARVSIGNNAQLFDLASVEVLKGPQGTLFGRSTTGGAILFNPALPADEFGGNLQTIQGDYDWSETSGVLNVPLIDGVLSARLAGNIVRRDGFTKALNTGQTLDNRDRDSFRLGVSFTPNESIDSYFMYAHNKVNENNSGSVLYKFDESFAIYDTTPFQGAGWAVVALPPGIAPDFEGYCYTYNPGDPAGTQSCIDERLGLLNELNDGLLAEQARVEAGGDNAKRRNVAGGQLLFKGKTEQLLNITSVEAGTLGFLGDVTFKNIFSTVRNLGVRTKYDGGNPYPNGLVYNNFDFQNFQPTSSSDADGSNDWLDDYTEEFQVAGLIDGKHSWILGYYYESQEYDLTYPPLFALYNNVTTAELTPSVVGTFGANQKETQEAVFAQTTIDLSSWILEGLSFTGGYRWTESTRKGKRRDPDPAALAQGNLEPSAEQTEGPRLDDSAPSWTVSFDYMVNEDTLVYLAHRRGFKPGGTNVAPVEDIPEFEPTYDPEEVDDIELGMKTDWELMGRPMRTNASVYKMWYNNIQRSESFTDSEGVPYTQTANIAKAEIEGLELSTQLLATDRLQLGLTYSYIDAKYTKWPGTTTNIITGETVNYKDSPYVGTPEHQGTVTVAYSLPVPGEWGEMTLRADYYLQSSVWLNDTALVDSFGKEDGYENLNLRYDWANMFGKPFDAAVFVKNATDDVHAVTLGSFYAFTGTAFAVYNEPRMWGVELRYRFGNEK
jgi:iron complex outermembrane recepter protein